MKTLKNYLLFFSLIIAVYGANPALDCWASAAEKIKFLIDREYFQGVRSLLREAKESIQVMMFEASYYKNHSDTPSNRLIEELLAAQKRGVQVEVVLDVQQDNERTTKRNMETGSILNQGGVSVTLDENKTTTHTKLLIIDGAIVVLGSTNWTYSALTKNHEVSVIIYSQEAARQLQDYFNKVKLAGKKL